MAIPEVSTAELARVLEAGARVYDVREPHEYTDAHVPGAQLIPLAQVPASVDAFRGDGPAYLVCRSGGRSRRAAEFLADQGIEVVNVAGGTLAWMVEGRAVVTGELPS